MQSGKENVAVDALAHPDQLQHRIAVRAQAVYQFRLVGTAERRGIQCVDCVAVIGARDPDAAGKLFTHWS